MLLEITNLSVEFRSLMDQIKALHQVSLSVDKGEIVGVVGESGSGKSVTALSILGLLDKNARISGGGDPFQRFRCPAAWRQRAAIVAGKADRNGLSGADECA
ncbi:ATP-binding cassette domain-containing protein [Brevibacillus humidisoli]|uniref:ATP-binding cassette domain-containing protein n=1 Tax=Brevibacillus humidisoli TaxID=2895522 RepID=UPI0030B9F16E